MTLPIIKDSYCMFCQQNKPEGTAWGGGNFICHDCSEIAMEPQEHYERTGIMPKWYRDSLMKDLLLEKNNDKT
jgi:hypothetical protein